MAVLWLKTEVVGQFCVFFQTTITTFIEQLIQRSLLSVYNFCVRWCMGRLPYRGEGSGERGELGCTKWCVGQFCVFSNNYDNFY